MQTETHSQAGVQIGSKIVRVNSDKHYNGKTGIVIEVKGERARVQWDSGSPRTWVGFRFLQSI